MFLPLCDRLAAGVYSDERGGSAFRARWGVGSLRSQLNQTPRLTPVLAACREWHEGQVQIHLVLFHPRYCRK